MFIVYLRGLPTVNKTQETSLEYTVNKVRTTSLDMLIWNVDSGSAYQKYKYLLISIVVYSVMIFYRFLDWRATVNIALLVTCV